MNIQYHKEYSHSMGRDMEWKEYGEGQHSILAIPSQDGHFYDWEAYQMVATLAPWIESGKVRLVCCDAIDQETWSNFGDPSNGSGPAHNRWRIEQHERWFHYIVDELLPRCRRWEGETFLVTGCSLGAFHAANFFFRRPDLFDTIIAMSGLYNASYGFPNYGDELTYANSPIDFLRQMPADHPWMQQYRQRRLIFCVGQGRWEDELAASTRELDTILKQRGIPAWFDYWGHDSDHDWPWWRKQLPYFMGVLENI